MLCLVGDRWLQDKNTLARKARQKQQRESMKKLDHHGASGYQRRIEVSSWHRSPPLSNHFATPLLPLFYTPRGIVHVVSWLRCVCFHRARLPRVCRRCLPRWFAQWVSCVPLQSADVNGGAYDRWLSHKRAEEQV